MPIILAIEPDKRQAAHVSAIVRHRVGAELILADTTEGALDAIGTRVPDVVLVPALLSPQDDAALAAALRVIAAAAHVRTLTIPVFANGVSHDERGGGLLSRWRRSRSDAAGGGCDPAVFAEQILDYLREAAAERADAAEEYTAPAPAYAAPAPAVSAAPPVVEPAFAEFETIAAPANANASAAPPPVEEFAPLQFEEYAAAPAFEPIAAFETPAAAEPTFIRDAPAFVRAEPELVRDAPAEEPFEFMYATEPASSPYAATPNAETPSAEDESDDVVIDLSEDIEEISPDMPADELFDGEPMGVYTISGLDESLREFEAEPIGRAAAPFDAASFDAPIARSPIPAAAPPARVERTVVEPPLAAAASIEHERPKTSEPREASWANTGLRHSRSWPSLEGVVAESPASLVGLEEFSEALATPAPPPPRQPAAGTAPPKPSAAPPPPAPPSPAPASKPDHMEWAELVASLRQDIERRRNQPAAPAAPAAAKQAAPAKPAVAPRVESAEPQEPATVAVPARRRRPAAPVQDEWGLFDPEQCGFAALLAKLDEFSDTAS